MLAGAWSKAGGVKKYLQNRERFLERFFEVSISTSLATVGGGNSHIFGIFTPNLGERRERLPF